MSIDTASMSWLRCGPRSSNAAVGAWLLDADPTTETATEYLCALTDDLSQAQRHKHIRGLGNTLRNWAAEILAWHTTGASSGPTEGQNNLIKDTKRVGFGFRTFRNYRIRVLLDAGGVNWNLLPTLTPP